METVLRLLSVAVLCIFLFRFLGFHLSPCSSFLVYRHCMHFMKLILMSYFETIVMLFTILFLMFLFCISHAVDWNIAPPVATVFNSRLLVVSLLWISWDFLDHFI